MSKMVRGIAVSTVLVAAVAFSSNAFARAWRVPSNVRVVQQNEIDTAGNIYPTIQSAIDSIGNNATESNPYVVKVMPGVYNEKVTLKSFISIKGSGRESTIVQYDINNVDFDTCTEGTIIMADNSSIKNLKVVNAAGETGSNENLVAGVVFNNVKASAEGVNIQIGNSTTHSHRNNGICAVGSSSQATLKDVNIDITTLNGDANAVLGMEGGNMTITNSRLIGTAVGDNAATDVVDCVGNMAFSGTLNISDTYVESNTTSSNNVWPAGVWIDGCLASLSNIIVQINSVGNRGCGVDASREFRMEHSQISVPEGQNAICWDPSNGTAKIATSKIDGIINNLTNMKLVNNYDGGFNPIANQ